MQGWFPLDYGGNTGENIECYYLLPTASLTLTDPLPAKKPGMLSFPGASGSHARENNNLPD